MSAEPESPWISALAELEDTLEGVSNPWTPPDDLGPLPAELEERARDILERQRAAMTEIESSRAAIAEQLAAVRTLPTSLEQRESVYLDTTA